MGRAVRFRLRLSRRSQVSAGAVATCVLCISTAAPAGATLLDLGTLGGANSEAVAINNAGQISTDV